MIPRSCPQSSAICTVITPDPLPVIAIHTIKADRLAALTALLLGTTLLAVMAEVLDPAVIHPLVPFIEAVIADPPDSVACIVIKS